MGSRKAAADPPGAISPASITGSSQRGKPGWGFEGVGVEVEAGVARKRSCQFGEAKTNLEIS